MTTISLVLVLSFLPWIDAPSESTAEWLPELPIAWTSIGPITATEVLREHRYLERDEQRWRKEEGHEGLAAWREWSQRVALRKVARSRPETTALLESPTLRELMRRGGRDWWLARWAEQCYGLPLRKSSDEEIEKLLAGEERNIPDRLRLSHVFLRAESPQEIADAIDQLQEWGREVEDLEDFSHLAREHSDSLSAPKGGSLGWLRKGWLPADAEEVLYEVPEGMVSPPLALRGGVHLFFVEAKDRARREITPAQVHRARGRSFVEQRAACRERRISESSLVPKVGAGVWPDLEVGDWSISGVVLKELYGQRVESSSERVSEWIDAETLYQLALSSGALSSDERARLADLEDNVLLGALVDSSMPSSFPDPSESELEGLFSERSSNYRTTRSLRLEVLRAQVPEGTDPIEFLDCLTSASYGLGEGTMTWVEAGKSCPGTAYESWPLLPMLAVASQSSPSVLSQVKDLAEGEVSAPIQSGEDFFVVGMVESVPDRAMTFEESRSRLRREFLRARRQEFRSQFVIGLLSSVEFGWAPGGEEWMMDQTGGSADDSLFLGEGVGVESTEP
ncbi:MAG: peptidylprolyl isomerase [Thermoanaerobaculia bacterium]|nr:peptidylprolyl isomerase [Thermoanaerobaculia bacterium]